MNECGIAPGQRVEAAEVLHLAEQALHPGALFLEPPISLAGAGAGRMGWGGMTGTTLSQLGICGAIGEQRDGFGHVASLPRGQCEPQRVAEAVGHAGLWEPRTPQGTVQLAEPAAS